MQNAFPLPEGPGPVTEQRDWWRSLGGWGKELGAEPEKLEKEEVGYKRWTCRGRCVRPGKSRGRREETGRPKKEVGKQTIPSPISCRQSSP